MTPNLPHIAEQKIEVIRDEFHEWNGLDIQPGLTVNDLMTRDQCARAITQLNDEIRIVNDQLAQARLDHAKGRKQLDGDWVHRAQRAIRYKRIVITAIRGKMESIPRSERREDFRKLMIEVIREDLGDDRMTAYAEETRRRYPHAAREEGA